MRRKQSIEQQKTSKNAKRLTDVNKRILPVLPLPGQVLYPNPKMTHAYQVVRKQSVAAVRRAIETNSEVLLLTMKRELDSPQAKHLYEIGVLGEILQWLDLQDGSIRLLISSIARVRVLELFEGGEFLEASVEAIADGSKDESSADEDAEIKALVNNLISALRDYISTAKRLPTELVEQMEEISSADDPSDPVQLSNILSQCLAPTLGVQVQQEILETLDIKKRLEKLIEVILRFKYMV